MKEVACSSKVVSTSICLSKNMDDLDTMDLPQEVPAIIEQRGI